MSWRPASISACAAQPTLGNESVGLLKSTSLASVVGVSELTMRSQTIVSENFLFIPVLMATGAIYVLMSSVMAIGQWWLESRVGLEFRAQRARKRKPRRGGAEGARGGVHQRGPGACGGKVRPCLGRKPGHGIGAAVDAGGQVDPVPLPPPGAGLVKVAAVVAHQDAPVMTGSSAQRIRAAASISMARR